MKEFSTKKYLNEEYQKTGIVFAFFNTTPEGENYMCHQWVKCRDFLHDAVRTQLNRSEMKLYEFEFGDSNPKISIEDTRIIVSKDGLKDKDVDLFNDEMLHGLSILNHFEEILNVEKTKIERVEVEVASKRKNTTAFLFHGPKMWMESPFLISLFTFIIRLGCKKIEFKNGEELSSKLKEVSDSGSDDSDRKYLSIITYEKILAVLLKRYELFNLIPDKAMDSIFFDRIGIGMFHNYCGILSLIKGITPNKELNGKVKELL